MTNIDEKVSKLLAAVAELVTVAEPVSLAGCEVDEYIIPAPVYLRVAEDLAALAGQRMTCPGCPARNMEGGQ